MLLPCEAAVAGVTLSVNSVGLGCEVGSLELPGSDQLMEVSYNTASGSLSIVPEQSTGPLTLGPKGTHDCFLVFDGVGLTEDALKDWLRLCAKQVEEKLHSF